MMRLWLAAALWLALGLGALAQTVGLAELQQGARAGQAGAQYQLAERYRTGTGVLQNYARAVEWYAEAAAQGDARAQNSLGALYVSGLGVAPDPVRGLELLSEAAASGAPKHLHDLASALQSGIGTAPDPARAAVLYQQAADLGWVESTVSLGVLYQDGIGVERDIAKAIGLYSGPAEAGHPRAQNNLGLIYVRGEGVLQDYALAVDWFTRAAAQGLAVALTNLGVMYENGFGVQQDEEEAKRLYRLAGQGSADGGEAGPVLIFDARLQPPDPALAETYLASARAGDPVAQFLLGYLLATQAGSGSDYRDAAQFFQAAADKGMAAAMANLGVLTFEGKGVLQDFVDGYVWLTLASTGGVPGTIELRDRLASRMTPDQINAANAVAETRWVEMRGARQ